MLTSFIRTVILLGFVILTLRLMGKRQIGQLQPSELVVTILLSQIAATPMQDNDIPLMHTIVAILALAGIEILLSVLSMKSVKIRGMIDGNPVTVIKDGQIDQKQLKRLRYTIADVLEALRQKDIFDISSVHSAVAETNGNLSVLLKAPLHPAKTEIFRKDIQETGVPELLVADATIVKTGLESAGISEEKLFQMLKKEKVKLEEVFIFTVDQTGATYLVRKDKNV